MSRHSLVNGTIVVALLALALWTTISPATPLSDGGVRLLSKTALFVLVLLVTAFVRTAVGPNPKRQFGMAMGTIGGLAIGVAGATRASDWIGTDVSPLSALAGVFVGWLVAYQFIKHLPRGGASRPAPWRTW